MKKLYVDVKYTIWKRYYYNEKANLQEIIDCIKENDADYGVDEAEGYDYSEELFDTTTFVEPEDNDNQPTIEIFENDNPNILWDNVNKYNKN